MADIFLSYNKSDVELARRIAQALRLEGFSVWWDDQISPREHWDETLEREIAAAKAVLVLWTSSSTKSRWVRIEANYAVSCVPPKLIQARFDRCEIPIAFSLTQFAEVDRHRPDGGGGWTHVLGWIREALGAPPSQTPSPPERARPMRWPRWIENRIRAHRARRDRLEAAMRPIDRRVCAAMVTLGVLLFCGAIVALKLKADWLIDVRISFLLTPLFSVPLMIALLRRGQIRWLGSVYFVLGLVIFHFVAIVVTDGIYHPAEMPAFACGGFFADRNDPAVRACFEGYVERDRQLAPIAGLAGGALGAALSFLGLMLVARRLHTTRRIAVMAASTAILTVLAFAAFSIKSLREMSPWDWSLGLFLPWQLVFGATLALLFDGRAMSDTTTP